MVEKIKRLFTEKERLEILELLIEEFEKDKRIVGVIKVGSSAYDFKDRYSDLDFAIVVDNSEDLMIVFKDWYNKIVEMFTIIQYFETIYSPESLLHGFLLDNYLELDIGFQPLRNIYAKRKHWKIAFDKTGKLAEIMTTTWEERKESKFNNRLFFEVKACWYYFSKILIAIARKNLWRAYYELNELRKMIVLVVNERYNYRNNRFQEITRLPQEIHKDLKESILLTMNNRALFENLKKLGKVLFREAKITYKSREDIDIAKLENDMNRLISIYEKELFMN